MTKLGRKSIYGDTCAVPGCNAPRHDLGGSGRSRYCTVHYKADMQARRDALPPAATGYTVAEAYKLWETNGMPPTFVYRRKQVYGIKACALGYSLVLAGADAAQWVAADARLKVKP
jgi:hypothetical protein